MLRYAVSQAATGQAARGHVILVLDIKSAFVHCETKGTIYVECPRKDRNGGHFELVGKLRKALHSTRAAPQQCQDHLSTTMKSIGVSELTCMSGFFQVDRGFFSHGCYRELAADGAQ